MEPTVSGTNDIEAEANLAIANALTTEFKTKYGEAVARKHTIVISLVEWERQEGDGPGTPRAQMSVKTLEPISPITAGRMLERASIQFRRAAITDKEM